MEKIYYIGEFSQLVGISVRTLQRWDKENLFPARRTFMGRRFYTPNDYDTILKLLHEPRKGKS